jgi:hypothetical protein
VLVAGYDSANDSGCRVCHSVSKDGSRLITQKHGSGDQNSVWVDLKNGNLEAEISQGDSAFPAIFPDGSRYFSSSSAGGPTGMIAGDASGHSQLYSLPSGMN